MMRFYGVLFIVIIGVFSENEDMKDPTILVSILVRNKAHTLPYFLSIFERLNYEKNRIRLW